MAASAARAAVACTARNLATTAAPAAAAAAGSGELPGTPPDQQHGARGATLFGQQAALYAQHRPDYPAALYDAVLSFAALPRRQLALDVATGTGQVAVELADRFEQVLACDSTQAQVCDGVAGGVGWGGGGHLSISGWTKGAGRQGLAVRQPTCAAHPHATCVNHLHHCPPPQLDHASRRPNITYRLAPAERLEGVQDGSVDLVTVAQAFHW